MKCRLIEETEDFVILEGIPEETDEVSTKGILANIQELYNGGYEYITGEENILICKKVPSSTPLIFPSSLV